MTAFDRFDPFERRISDAIDEIAVARPLDYLDDILRQTARSSQRPRWTFPERWLNVDTTLARPALARRVPIRPLIVIALLVAAIVAALAFSAGSPRLPAPFGPAGNGSFVYSADGDMFVLDELTGPQRLLVGGPGDDAFPFFSPNGRLLGFSTTIDGQEFLKVADANGSNVRQLLPEALNAAGAVWRPDSRAMAVDTTIDGVHRLLVVPVDGSAVTELDLQGLSPSSVVWRPTDGSSLLFRGIDAQGILDLYTINADGTGLHAMGLPGVSAMGPDWTLTGGVWSPDGATIAYNSIESGQTADNETVAHFRAHLIAPDGSNDRALPSLVDALYNQAWPEYSPDGRWIVMESWRTQPDGSAINQIVIVPADGSGPARPIGPSVPGQPLEKVWSPDGTQLVVWEGESGKLHAIDPVSGESRELAPADGVPDWQRVAP